MKMAKASEADLNMAMDLAAAIDVLGQRWLPCMPEAVETLEGEDERENFDEDNDAQCGRALRHLLQIARRGSISRVVYGAAVMLDPRNKLVDPKADTIERHPPTPDETRALSIADTAALAAVRSEGVRQADGREFVLLATGCDDHMKACFSHLYWRGIVEDWVIDMDRGLITLKMKEAQP